MRRGTWSVWPVLAGLALMLAGCESKPTLESIKAPEGTPVKQLNKELDPKKP